MAAGNRSGGGHEAIGFESASVAMVGERVANTLEYHWRAARLCGRKEKSRRYQGHNTEKIQTQSIRCPETAMPSHLSFGPWRAAQRREEREAVDRPSALA